MADYFGTSSRKNTLSVLVSERSLLSSPESGNKDYSSCEFWLAESSSFFCRGFQSTSWAFPFTLISQNLTNPNSVSVQNLKNVEQKTSRCTSLFNRKRVPSCFPRFSVQERFDSFIFSLKRHSQPNRPSTLQELLCLVLLQYALLQFSPTLHPETLSATLYSACFAIIRFPSYSLLCFLFPFFFTVLSLFLFTNRSLRRPSQLFVYVLLLNAQTAKSL